MADELRTKTVSTRVTPRVERVMRAGAEELGETLSTFLYKAGQERARRALLGSGSANGSSDEGAGEAGAGRGPSHKGGAA